MLEAMNELDELFRNSPVGRLHDEYLTYAQGSLAFYRNLDISALSDETLEFVATQAGSVGLDALQSIGRLTRLMIKDGVPAPASEAKLGRNIYDIQRIEDLLLHAHQIPTGLSLCVIRGQSIASSYFVMVVRTGSRILALTDKGKFEHPLQEQRMQSRNERFNAQRIDGSHFPYSLLKIQWMDRGRAAEESETRATNMTAAAGLPVLADISEMNDRELLWLQLFIDQCRARYFDQGTSRPLLATGSMLNIGHKLDQCRDQLPALAGRQLDLVTRTSKDLTAAWF